MTLKYIGRSFSLGCHFHVHFSYPWHAFASHGLPAIAELLVFHRDDPVQKSLPSTCSWLAVRSIEYLMLHWQIRWQDVSHCYCREMGAEIWCKHVLATVRVRHQSRPWTLSNRLRMYCWVVRWVHSRIRRTIAYAWVCECASFKPSLGERSYARLSHLH